MVMRGQGEPQPRIATIVSRGVSSFGALISALDEVPPESAVAVSHFARFKLWAGTLGAHRPGGSRSLEYRLRDASPIKHHIISLLQDLCESVEDGILAAKGATENAVTLDEQDVAGLPDSTDAELEDYFRDGGHEHSEISRILDYVGQIVDCLLRLSITIRNPAPHDHFQSRAGTDVVGLYEQWDIKHVREKFPSAHPGLAERLGKATAWRRQYFKYREMHAHKLTEGLDTAVADGGDEGEAATTVASSIPKHLKEPQTAGIFAEIEDSESMVSKTSYAPSTAEEAQLRVLPLPREHAAGPFKCPYCCMIVSINTRHEWKKHVFRDLRPYVCLSSSCTTPDQQYLRRSDWIEHMKQDHWRIWRCPLGCSDNIFSSTREFERHVKEAHASQGPSRHVDALHSLGSYPDPTKAEGKCPLCCMFQIMSEKQYGSHVAAHLEQLALFALPNTGVEGDESDNAEDESSRRGGNAYDTVSLDSVDANSIAQGELADEPPAANQAANSANQHELPEDLAGEPPGTLQLACYRCGVMFRDASGVLSHRHETNHSDFFMLPAGHPAMTTEEEALVAQLAREGIQIVLGRLMKSNRLSPTDSEGAGPDKGKYPAHDNLTEASDAIRGESQTHREKDEAVDWIEFVRKRGDSQHHSSTKPEGPPFPDDNHTSTNTGDSEFSKRGTFDPQWERNTPNYVAPEPGDTEDVLFLKHQGSTYPAHFPPFSISQGTLLVRDLATRAAMIIGASAMQQAHFVYKGRLLEDSAAAVREYGIINKSDVLLVSGPRVLDFKEYDVENSVDALKGGFGDVYRQEVGLDKRWLEQRQADGSDEPWVQLIERLTPSSADRVQPGLTADFEGAPLDELPTREEAGGQGEGSETDTERGWNT